MTMSLTRRTFLQSSLMAGLAGAADATCTRWLLSRNDAIRVGVAGLGASASEHLAVFAAVPGAEIIGLADSDAHLVTNALSQLRKLRQPAPTAYRSVEHMLRDPSLEAVALPNEASGSDSIFDDIVNAGLPTLADFPPAQLAGRPPLYKSILRAQSFIHFRLADFMYPACTRDLANWLKRSGCKKSQAHLLISHTTTLQDLRVSVIVATDALLALSSLRTEDLLRWVSSNKLTDKLHNAGTLGSIELPENSAGITALSVHLLPRSSRDSKLVVEHRGGAMEVTISSKPDAYSSLQTAMRFLSGVRQPERFRDVPSTRAFVAAALVDALILHPLAYPTVAGRL